MQQREQAASGKLLGWSSSQGSGGEDEPVRQVHPSELDDATNARRSVGHRRTTQQSVGAITCSPELTSASVLTAALHCVQPVWLTSVGSR